MYPGPNFGSKGSLSSFGILVYIPSSVFSAPDKIKHIIYFFSDKKMGKSRLVVCKTRFYLLRVTLSSGAIDSVSVGIPSIDSPKF